MQHLQLFRTTWVDHLFSSSSSPLPSSSSPLLPTSNRLFSATTTPTAPRSPTRRATDRLKRNTSPPLPPPIAPADPATLSPELVASRERLKLRNSPLVLAVGGSKSAGALARCASVFWDDQRRLRVAEATGTEELVLVRQKLEREKLERALGEVLKGARGVGGGRGQRAGRGKRPSAKQGGGTGGRRGFASSAVAWKEADGRERLPTSEAELFGLLVRLRRLHQPPTAAFVASFHSHPLVRPFVSPRSYALVVHHCYERRDLRRARQVLDEMAERGIPRTDSLVRTLVRGALTRGDAARVQELGASERDRGGSLLPLLNWRRDLGEEGKGKGDVWKARTKVEARKIQEEWDRKVGARTTGAAGTRNSVEVHEDLDGRLKRQRTLIPRRVRGLANYDLTVLVESLVQDCRAPEAFHVAQAWLSSNCPKPSDTPPPPPPSPEPSLPHVIYRPAPIFILPRLRPPSASRSSPPSDSDTPFIRACATYEKTLLVLLNILLRALIIDGAPEPPCQAFITEFLSSNSPPSYRPIAPNSTTLLELVQSVRAHSPQWERACGIVEWMGRTYGLPKETTRERKRFREEDDGARMIEFVPPRIALLMLRLALEEEEIWTREGPKKVFAAKVRKWWSRIDRTSDLWVTAEAREVVKRAVGKTLVTYWEPTVGEEGTHDAEEEGRDEGEDGQASQKAATA